MTCTFHPPALLLILAFVVLLAAGCSTGASTSAGTGTGAASAGAVDQSADSGAAGAAGAQAKGVRFSECVRSHGVGDFPDPDSKGEFAYGVSVSPATFTEAVQACKALEPPGALSSKRTPKQQSASLKFAACMRKHGVKDFPDSVSGEPLINTEKIPSSNRPGGMTILNAAIDRCKGLAGLAAGGQG